MAALAYPETVSRAVRIIRAVVAGQELKAFPYRRVRAEFGRVGLGPLALSRLIKLGLLEECDVPGGRDLVPADRPRRLAAA